MGVSILRCSVSHTLRHVYFALLLILLGNSVGVHAASGIDWLAGQVNADGSYSNQNDIVTVFQATSESLSAINATGEFSQLIILPALQFINSESYHSTEYLSRKIIANANNGSDFTPLVIELKASQHFLGGFGELAGFDTTVLDTAFALQALAVIDDKSSSTVTQAISYLLQKQSADGSWTEGNSDSSVYITSLAVQSLTYYKAAYTGADSALAKARSYLLNQQQADASWGESFLTAQVLIALLPNVTDASVLDTSVAGLQYQQDADGSWIQEVYTTALALRALSLYENLSITPVDPTKSAIIGSTITAGSRAPLGGVTVVLNEVSSAQVITVADGAFAFSGLNAGSYTLVASKSGYTSVSFSVTVSDAQILQVGELALALLPDTGGIQGTITDAQTKTVLQGVDVNLTGSTNYSATTTTQGYFNISGLAHLRHCAQ